MNNHMFLMNFLTQIFCFEIITEIATEFLSYNNQITKLLDRDVYKELELESWVMLTLMLFRRTLLPKKPIP